MPDPTWKHKYYRAIGGDKGHPDGSHLSKKLFKITGLYPDDYIEPVLSEGGDIISIISDESEFKGHYCSSLVGLPYTATTIESHKDKEDHLQILVDKYNIPNIHMTDIFGKNRVLGKNIKNFFDEYITIVEDIPMSCLALSNSKATLLNQLKKTQIADEELYFTLFWNNIGRLFEALQTNSIIHIWIEQQYYISLKNTHAVIPKLFQQLRSGIKQVTSYHNDKYISICKHPHYFTKTALLYSSLSDIAAYTCNKVQQKIDTGVPLHKISKEYKIPLQLTALTHEVFSHSQNPKTRSNLVKSD